jgi:ABC-2 type transport system ATP-binding protein
MRIISTNSISKYYKKFIAVDNLSIDIDAGEIYGFLGLNGAGKTTTIRMLLGMIKPGSGSVSLFEKDITHGYEKWNDVGYLVETPYAYPNLSVEENLEICFYYRKLKDRKLLDAIIEKLHLEKYRHTRAARLSLGNRQRLGLAKALMHQPKLLILDEPINGLDPAGIVEVRELLKALAREGATIFLSSHILGEISKIATRVGIIHEGKLIKELYTDELEQKVNKKLIIDTDNNQHALAHLIRAGYNAVLNSAETIEIIDPAVVARPENISALLAHSDILLKQLFVSKEDLESYFLSLIHKEDHV